MSAAVMSFVTVVVSSLLYLIAAVAVAIIGRGQGRVLTVAGLLLGLLHNLSNVFLFPLLGRATADPGFWARYMAYNVASTIATFLTWGLIAAGVILMSRRVLRRPAPAPAATYPAAAAAWGEQPTWGPSRAGVQGTGAPWPATSGPAGQSPRSTDPGSPWGREPQGHGPQGWAPPPPSDPSYHPGQSGATSARNPGQ